MESIITKYPSVSPDKECLILDDAQRNLWEEMHLLEEIECFLSWKEVPKKEITEKFTRIRVLANSKDITELPKNILLFSQLLYINFPRRFAKKLLSNSIPETVKILHLSGQGPLTWPEKIILPSIECLESGEGVTKFKKANFPQLKTLTIKLDSKAIMLDVITKYEFLTDLHLIPVHTNEIFTQISSLPLDYFGISGGKINTLSGIGQLDNITHLSLSNLSQLQSLQDLDCLSSLTRLSVYYCKNLQSLSEIFRLPSLQKLRLIGCGDIGLQNFRSELKSMNLEELITSGTR